MSDCCALAVEYVHAAAGSAYPDSISKRGNYNVIDGAVCFESPDLGPIGVKQVSLAGLVPRHGA